MDKFLLMCYDGENQHGDYMKAKKYEIGTAFGDWTTISDSFSCEVLKGKRRFITCECVCGNKRDVRVSNLVSGKSTDCGCTKRQKLIQRNTSHSLSMDSNTGKHCVYYNRVKNAYDRCYNEKNRAYVDYGGRGIRVDFENKEEFIKFIKFELPGYQEGYSLDRIDNDGNYSKTNLRWADGSTQTHNQRTQRNNTSGFKGLTRRTKLKVWRVCVQLTDLNIDKTFSDKKYGGTESAKAAAIAYIESIRKEYNLPTYS
jgi:predicted HAD superfamily hydrolase